jgi:hypothetical protein
MTALPRPRPRVLALQIVLFLLCGLAVYFALHTFMEWQNYRTAAHELTLANSRAMHLAHQLEAYQQFTCASPWYSQDMKNPRWEKVDETWIELPWQTLINRLSSLYRLDRPFVLKSFTTSNSPQKQENKGAQVQQREQLTFKLQGYFLCPTH